jgi:hypothetical protein
MKKVIPLRPRDSSHSQDFHAMIGPSYLWHWGCAGEGDDGIAHRPALSDFLVMWRGLRSDNPL